MYNTLFKSVAEMRAPSQGERVLQRAFMSQAQSVVSKATGNGGSGGGSGSSMALKGDDLGATPGFGDPSQNLAPTVDITLADNSRALLLQLSFEVENSFGEMFEGKLAT